MPATFRELRLPLSMAIQTKMVSGGGHMRGLTKQRDERITKTPGVIGGDACISGHRIAVWMLEGYRRLGMTDERILAAFPTITAADLAATWDYADEHREEMDQALRDNE